MALVALCCQCHVASGDAIDIPDPWFLEYLVGVADQDGDGNISQEEALEIKEMNIPPMGIRSLKGIQAFTALEILSITSNPVDSINLEQNSALVSLNIYSCGTRDLRLATKPELLELRISRNQLEEFSLEGFPILEKFFCTNNLFTSLDVSVIPGLVAFRCCGNQIEYLDVSINQNLTLLGIDNMPMLNEVCTWTLPFPPEGVQVIMGYSPNVSFTTTCLQE